MPAPVIAADRQVGPVRHKGALIALASRTRITGAATPVGRSRTRPECACLRSAEIAVYKPHTRTSQDAPGKPVAPLHGGGQGFESPRLHFRKLSICR
jgi:hypothetical protein